MRQDLQPYSARPVELAPGLLVWDGEWYNTPFKRRMTLVQLGGGGLFVHNPIQLKEDDYHLLENLGPVRWIVAPNNLHASDASLYKNRFPNGLLYAPRGAAKKLSKEYRVDGILGQNWPAEIQSEIQCIPFRGTRILDEHVFFHLATRTLIVTDLIFHMRMKTKGLQRLFFRWNKIDQRFGPSRAFKWIFINNCKLMKESFEKIMQCDFDRVIMNHGEVLSNGGKQAMKRGFLQLGLLH